MVNKITLLGRVGQAPELKHLESGTSVTKFSLATSESWKNKEGEKVEETQWHNCEVWGKGAEIITKYVGKGDLLYLEGSVAYDSYEDKDGNTKYFTKIKVRDFKFMPKAVTNSDLQNTSELDKQMETAVANDEEGELPF